VSAAEATSMLEELTMAPWLRGVRGEDSVDVAAVADAISRFSQLTVDAPELRELEINPLVASRTGAVAVDARGTLLD
jgi:acetyltransferase